MEGRLEVGKTERPESPKAVLKKRRKIIAEGKSRCGFRGPVSCFNYEGSREEIWRRVGGRLEVGKTESLKDRKCERQKQTEIF